MPQAAHAPDPNAHTDHFLSDRVKGMAPSATIAVTNKARQMRAAGEPVIGLGAGEPDFDTPEHIKKAAQDAMQKGETKYTAVGGTDALKKAIISKFSRENNLTYAMDEVTAATGAKQIIFNAMLATLNEGDEVIVPAPYWVSYPDIAQFAGGTPVSVLCTEADSFKLTADLLESHITENSKWLILNSPSNPTGAAYTRDELEDIADVLRKHPQILILSDDIYEHLIYEDLEFYTLAEIAPDLKSRTLTLNGVSKAYSMTGWRLGYAGGPAWLIKAMEKIQSQSTSNPSSISQAATIAALEGGLDFLADWKVAFKERRDLVVSRLNGIDGIKCESPPGAFYVFPSCKRLFGKKTVTGKTLFNSLDVADYLLESAKVAVVPGSAFGLEGHFRISYATSTELLSDACTRIKEAVSKLIID